MAPRKKPAHDHTRKPANDQNPSPAKKTKHSSSSSSSLPPQNENPSIPGGVIVTHGQEPPRTMYAETGTDSQAPRFSGTTISSSQTGGPSSSGGYCSSSSNVGIHGSGYSHLYNALDPRSSNLPFESSMLHNVSLESNTNAAQSQGSISAILPSSWHQNPSGSTSNPREHTNTSTQNLNDWPQTLPVSDAQVWRADDVRQQWTWNPNSTLQTLQSPIPSVHNNPRLQNRLGSTSNASRAHANMLAQNSGNVGNHGSGYSPFYNASTPRSADLPSVSPMLHNGSTSNPKEHTNMPTHNVNERPPPIPIWDAKDWKAEFIRRSIEFSDKWGHNLNSTLHSPIPPAHNPQLQTASNRIPSISRYQNISGSTSYPRAHTNMLAQNSGNVGIHGSGYSHLPSAPITPNLHNTPLVSTHAGQNQANADTIFSPSRYRNQSGSTSNPREDTNMSQNVNDWPKPPLSVSAAQVQRDDARRHFWHIPNSLLPSPIPSIMQVIFPQGSHRICVPPVDNVPRFPLPKNDYLSWRGFLWSPIGYLVQQPQWPPDAYFYPERGHNYSFAYRGFVREPNQLVPGYNIPQVQQNHNDANTRDPNMGQEEVQQPPDAYFLPGSGHNLPDIHRGNIPSKYLLEEHCNKRQSIVLVIFSAQAQITSARVNGREVLDHHITQCITHGRSAFGVNMNPF